MNDIIVGVYTGSPQNLAEFKARVWPVTDAEHYGNQLPDFGSEEFVLAATHGERVVGYCKFHTDTGIGLIDSIVVDPAMRGAGVGSRLLQATEELLKQQGVHKVWLETGTAWKARNFYLKHGYTERAILPNHYGHQDFVLFDKML